jgi:prepilin-type N-terminal cleavage/methylation domain-containing protein
MNQRIGQQGLSLVELLISMAILGILLAVLSAFLIGNQRVTSSQITAATLNNDVRLAFLRIGELVTQAHYIYPANQEITIKGTKRTTGNLALAILVPEGTTYCKATGTGNTYCGFAYVIEDRTPYADLLGAGGGTTGLALVEHKQEGLIWPQFKQPATELKVWATPASEPVVDSVDSSSNLAGVSTLQKGNSTNSFDGNAFDNNAVMDNSKAVVAAVNSSLILERTINGKAIKVSRDNFVFSRTAPRATQPTKP